MAQLMVSQKQHAPRQGMAVPQTAANYRKGCCFAFNEQQCRWNASCKYRHEYSFCAGAHPVAKCFKKNAAVSAPGQRDIFPKACTPVRLEKNAPMVGSVPKAHALI